MAASDSEISRREWIRSLTAAMAASWPAVLAAQQHAHRMAASEAPASFQFFDAASAGEVEAIAAQVIPSGETPGAREAGVVYFIDRALSTFDKDKQDDYHRGLASLAGQRLAKFPGSKSFASLPQADQIVLLQSIETSPFFDLVRVHTVTGFFANPSYGGNRGLAGWKLIGFEDTFQFTPPFGYYDANYKGGNA